MNILLILLEDMQRIYEVSTTAMKCYVIYGKQQRVTHDLKRKTQNKQIHS